MGAPAGIGSIHMYDVWCVFVVRWYDYFVRLLRGLQCSLMKHQHVFVIALMHIVNGFATINNQHNVDLCTQIKLNIRSLSTCSHPRSLSTLCIMYNAYNSSIKNNQTLVIGDEEKKKIRLFFTQQIQCSWMKMCDPVVRLHITSQ